MFTVPTSDDDGSCAELMKALCEHASVLCVEACERLSLKQVGRHDRCQRKQPRNESIDRIVPQQTGSGRRHEHRVDDERNRLIGQIVGDGLDDRSRREHARLAGVDTDVGEDSVELLSYERWRNLVYPRYASRVLSCQGHDHARAVTPGAGECLEIGLDARTTTGIGSRDGETARHGHSSTLAVRSLYSRPLKGGCLAETYTHTTWKVKPGMEDEFVLRWSEWIEWSHLQGLGPQARLLRDAESPSTFVSFGPWLSRDSVKNWRAAAGYHERVARMQEVLESFEPRTLELVAEG
jgi:heme-degrading monooxygenase HmoA